MLSLTDMHCHILPGVDDGCRSMDETLVVLREAKRQGIDRMIVTPHYHPGRYLVDAKEVLEKLASVQKECVRQGIDVRLYPGQECYWFSGLIDALDSGKALTMNRSGFVLVEFDPGTIYSVIQNAVRSLENNGYQPIIAHFERYECLRGREERLEELRGAGAFLQLNFDRILDKDTLFHRNVWRRYIKEGYVDFLGSDTHGMDFRPLHVAAAGRWLEQEIEESMLWEMLERNIDRLL